MLPMDPRLARARPESERPYAPGESEFRTDLERIRSSLHAQLGGLDAYCDLEDPVLSGEVTSGSLSADLVSVAADLCHALDHYRADHLTEAMWWWQFSYLSDWGERAASALRVIQALLAHIRLDADADLVSEAEFDALHP